MGKLLIKRAISNLSKKVKDIESISEDGVNTMEIINSLEVTLRFDQARALLRYIKGNFSKGKYPRV